MKRADLTEKIKLQGRADMFDALNHNRYGVPITDVSAGNFGQVIRRNYPVAIGTRMASAPAEVVSVVGPLCTPLDVLAEKMPLPRAAPGDLVVVFQSGAYGLSASPQDFLSHPRTLEVLV